MPSDNEKRDEVLKKLLKTQPKPHALTKEELAELGKAIGQIDPDEHFGPRGSKDERDKK